MENKDILNFIFELGQLSKKRNTGWHLIGDNNPQSVAEHVLRAAQIGFILAKLENYENPLEICGILVFHDIGECRVNDLDNLAKRYVIKDEERAVKDQTEKLGEIGKETFELWKKCENLNSETGIIAKDADLLEHAFTAKEYLERGYLFAQDWINNISKRLKTESAKKLLENLKEMHSNEWWQGLKKIP